MSVRLAGYRVDCDLYVLAALVIPVVVTVMRLGWCPLSSPQFCCVMGISCVTQVH